MAFCILGILIDEFNPFTFIVIPNGLNFLICFLHTCIMFIAHFYLYYLVDLNSDDKRPTII